MTADMTVAIDEIYGHGFGVHIKNLIAQYRQTQNLALFDDFKFDIVHDIRFGDIDKNFYQKNHRFVIIPRL